MPFLYFAAISALIGLFPMPYVGYMLVKVGVAAGCLIALWTISKKNFLGLSSSVWLVLIAVLYNPIMPIFLTREIWIVADIFVAIILISIAHTINEPSIDKNISENEAQTKSQLDMSKLQGLEQSFRKIAQKTERKGDEIPNTLIVHGLVLLAIFAIISVVITNL